MDEPTERATPPSLRPGATFGHYRLRRLLGRCGFGEVYEADDTIMECTVALKLLSADYSENEAFRQADYPDCRRGNWLWTG